MSVTNRWEQTDWVISILLFLGISSLYFAASSGITSSNDGSHYALLRTLVENQTFALEEFDDYAEGNDIAISEDGRLFSDRPPGTALLGTLFYRAAIRLPNTLAPLPSRHDFGNPKLLFVMLLPVLAGAGTVVLLYALMRELALSRAAALTASLMFALGTVHWKYSTVLFSHALSSFLVILALYLTIGIARQTKVHWGNMLFLGFILGYAVLVEYSNALLVILIGIYLLWYQRPFTYHKLLTIFGPFVAGGLVSGLFLAFYNDTNFGSPFRLSYAYAVNYPWASSFLTTFNYPPISGLRALLVWGSGDGWCNGTCYNQGVFLLSPVLILAIPGWVPYWRKARQECALTTAVFLVYLLLFSLHRTSHGFTADGRYLVPFLGLLAIPLGYAFHWLLTLWYRPVLQSLLLLISYGLFFLSLRNMFFHIGHSFNYVLNLGQLVPPIAQPDNWRYLFHQVFRNFSNLPFLWLIELLVLALLLFVWWILTSIKGWISDQNEAH
jgi:4-amino-4-deoxy-L-arabinose transferase-like glycosyltransferase